MLIDGYCVPASGGASGTGGSTAGGSQGSGGTGPVGSGGSGASVGNAGGSTGSGGNAGGSTGSGGNRDGDGGINPDGGGTGGAPDGGGDPGLVTDALDCGSRDVTGATVVEGVITSSTTWSGVVHVKSSVSVRNEAVLTIAPGTKVIVGLNANIEFGWQGSRPTLLALGTKDAPIRICGEAGRAAYWGRLLLLESVKPESKLRNVLVADGGSDGNGQPYGGALTLNVPATVQGVQVRGSAGDAVYAAGYGPGSEALIVKDAKEAPIRATGSGGVDVPPRSDLTGNARDFVRTVFTKFDGDAHFHGRYRQEADINGLANGAGPVSLTFAPGTDYEFFGQRTLVTGNASVRAVGTAASPVVFRGATCAFPDPGCIFPPRAGAARIVIGSGAPSVRLEHVMIRQGGWTELDQNSTLVTYRRFGILEVQSAEPITLTHVEISDALGYALGFTGQAMGLTPESSDVSLSGTPNQSPTPAEIYMGTSGCKELFNAPLLALGTAKHIACGGIDVAGTVKAGTYTVSSSLMITKPVTFEPSTSWYMEGYSPIRVSGQGSISAVGTASAPVTFSGGSFWLGIEVASPNSVFDHAVVRAGGYSANPTFTNANIRALVPVAVRNSTIAESKSYGIARRTTDVTNYTSTNTFSGNASGNVGDLTQ